MIPFVPVLPEQSSLYRFPSLKNATLLSMFTNILTLLQREGTTSIEVRQPSACHVQDGIGEGREDLQIADYRDWTETAKEEQRKWWEGEKNVHELRA